MNVTKRSWKRGEGKQVFECGNKPTSSTKCRIFLNQVTQQGSYSMHVHEVNNWYTVELPLQD